MADTSWMTEPVAGNNPQGQFPWLTLANMLGTAGAGMLRGTNQEWLATPGATAAQMASNQLSGDKMQSLLQALERSAARTSADKNTPALGGTNLKLSLDPTGQYPTGVSMGTTYKHGEGVQPIPPNAEPVKTAIGDELNSQLPQALASPSALNFPQALLRVR